MFSKIRRTLVCPPERGQSAPKPRMEMVEYAHDEDRARGDAAETDTCPSTMTEVMTMERSL
jgi:hypothetical protein